jgi:hypothetical protein
MTGYSTLRRGKRLERTPWRPKPRRTGFSAAVKLGTRKRAGGGDPDEACCEPCGRWLGRYGGQVHHRQNRQMGGSKLRNGIQNAGLLCGTPASLCHGDATLGTEAMKDTGWVLRSGTDPASTAVTLHDGRRVLLGADGQYKTAPAEGVAA